ncbi:DUF2474 family protein [Vibrio agarivorans]
MSVRVKRALWFLAIWSASVLSLFIVSYAIRSVLM